MARRAPARFTRAAIDAMQPGPADQYLWDPGLPGFGVKVTPRGRKIWLVRFRLPGVPNGKMMLGRVCDLGLEDARQRARDAFNMVWAGKDPRRGGSAEATTKTLQALADTYLREHAQVWKAKASAAADDRNWRLHVLPALGADRAIGSITRLDIQRLHAAIGAKNPTLANRVLALLSKAFSLAVEWRWLGDEAHPCRNLRKFKESKRARPIRPDELAALGDALRTLERTKPTLWRGINLFWLWILTGARMSEVMHARWEWVDLERRLILLPKSKTGEKVIRLPAAAIDRVRALPSRGSSDWLFPGNRAGEPMKNPRHTVAKTLRDAGVKDLRIHDLRHIFGSTAMMTGANLKAVADLLGHTQLATTERYVQGVGDEAARVGDAAAGAIAGLMGAQKVPAPR